jgi:hypothetical protein
VRDLDAYARAALNREIERVRAAAPGGRNHALNKAAWNLGRLTGAALPAELVQAELYTAAGVHFTADPPLTPAEARATIRSALAAAQRTARDAA